MGVQEFNLSERIKCMNRKALWIVTCAVLLCCQLVSSASAISNGEKFNGGGMIIGRDGETFTMRTLEFGNVVVVLTDRTKVVQPKGLLKLRKTDMGMTANNPYGSSPVQLVECMDLTR